MAYTIATHNGTSAHRAHNIRAERVVEKQEHIDRNGKFEIWHDESPREAYERIFGEYVKEYNENQKRPERRIDDYYKDICNDKKRNAVYEMIISVGNKENSLAEDNCRQILHEFVYGNEDIGMKSWSERNPNLELIGAYYHADEQGVPHVHIDYVPIAHGYKRGMWAQNGLDKALREMGYEHHGNHATPQIQWEKNENRQLENLCQWHGVEVEHPMADKGVQHVHTELYKAKAEYNKVIDNYKAQIENLENTLQDLQFGYENMERAFDSMNQSVFDRMDELEVLDKDIQAGNDELQEIQSRLKGVHELKDMVDGLLRDYDELMPKVKEKLQAQENALDRMKNFDWNYYMAKWQQELEQERKHPSHDRER